MYITTLRYYIFESFLVEITEEEFDQADDDAPVDKEEVVFGPFVADEVEDEITKPEIVANDEDVEAADP